MKFLPLILTAALALGATAAQAQVTAISQMQDGARSFSLVVFDQTKLGKDGFTVGSATSALNQIETLRFIVNTDLNHDGVLEQVQIDQALPLGNAFVGIQVPTAFTDITLVGAGGATQAFQADEFSSLGAANFTSVPVPEPRTGGTLMAGLGVMVLLARRHTARRQD